MEVDVIVVLGARVKQDFSPSEVLDQRLTLALALHRQRGLPLICCGAKGDDEPIAEGDFMRNWLADRGVSAECVYPECGSYDTMQNIRNAGVIMRDIGARKALVVTSDYHMRRALAICRRFGVPALGASCRSHGVVLLKNSLRELLAWGKYFLSYFIP